MKDSIKPVVRSKQSPIPVMRVGRTEANIHNPGITYNESGIAYNEVGYAYGGRYGDDYYPIIARASDISPHIRFGADFAGTTAQHGTIVLHRGMPMGPGFFMYITYPEDGTITF